MSLPNILQKILAQKTREVNAGKQQTPESVLRENLRQARQSYSLSEALSGPKLAIIAEIKKASPSAGVIRENFDPPAIAASYIEAGANAISMLTDEQFFQGSLDYITQVREITPIPILRKDFIIDAYQLLEAKAAGADAVLLIVAALERAQLRDLLQTAHELGLEALVETHSADEMETAIAVDAKIIGINNRNLETFQIDLATTEHLAPMAPSGTILVGESGLYTQDDVQRMIKAGVHAVLVGTHFMSDPDPGAALQAFKALIEHG